MPGSFPTWIRPNSLPISARTASTRSRLARRFIPPKSLASAVQCSRIPVMLGNLPIGEWAPRRVSMRDFSRSSLFSFPATALRVTPRGLLSSLERVRGGPRRFSGDQTHDIEVVCSGLGLESDDVRQGIQTTWLTCRIARSPRGPSGSGFLLIIGPLLSDDEPKVSLIQTACLVRLPLTGHTR